MDREKYGDFSDENVRRADGQGRAASEYSQGGASGDRASSGYQGESNASQGPSESSNQSQGVNDLQKTSSDAAEDESKVTAAEDTE